MTKFRISLQVTRRTLQKAERYKLSSNLMWQKGFRERQNRHEAPRGNKMGHLWQVISKLQNQQRQNMDYRRAYSLTSAHCAYEIRQRESLLDHIVK